MKKLAMLLGCGLMALAIGCGGESAPTKPAPVPPGAGAMATDYKAKMEGGAVAPAGDAAAPAGEKKEGDAPAEKKEDAPAEKKEDAPAEKKEEAGEKKE